MVRQSCAYVIQVSALSLLTCRTSSSASTVLIAHAAAQGQDWDSPSPRPWWNSSMAASLSSASLAKAVHLAFGFLSRGQESYSVDLQAECHLLICIDI